MKNIKVIDSFNDKDGFKIALLVHSFTTNRKDEFIVAFAYNDISQNWGYGHYHGSFESACNDYFQVRHINDETTD